MTSCVDINSLPFLLPPPFCTVQCRISPPAICSSSSQYFVYRLKELVPSVSAKDNVTQLDIILEAIRYIDSLQNRLADKIENGEIELLKVPVKKFKEN